MADNKDLKKLALIKKEKSRLTKIYKDVDEKKKATIQGLIERAAFMRVTLDETEADLIENGYVEMFSQGNQDPYERKRPVADFYNQLNNSFQKIIKQLTDLLPKEDIKEGEDDFNFFIKSRDEK